MLHRLLAGRRHRDSFQFPICVFRVLNCRAPFQVSQPLRVNIESLRCFTTMDQVFDVTKQDTSTDSNFVRPFKLFYTQNGKKKRWDCVKSHDSVAILIHHVERDTFVFVKQFRPAVYINVAEACGETGNSIDTAAVPGHRGITYEMCAGIVDKNCSLVEIAQMEVMEECGYHVPLTAFQKITTARSGVGTSGSLQTLFYVKVDDTMKQSVGGGNLSEGELIETVEVPVANSMDFIMDESKERPIAMIYGITWYHLHQANKSSGS